MHKILLDTNVLVDYYLGREPGCAALVRMIASSQEANALYVSSLSLKDVYYLVGATLKRAARMEAGTLSEEDELACNEIAWACVKHALDTFIVAGIGRQECLDAFVCRSVHGDFEDNLVLATGRAARVDFLVTGDETLLRHSPLAALAPTDMASLLEAEAAR